MSSFRKLVLVVLVMLVQQVAGATSALGHSGLQTPSVTPEKCEKISTDLCNQRYNNTKMPNFMGHTSQNEAILGLFLYEPFFTQTCSPYLRLFICSAFIPVCSEYFAEPIPPCRIFCEKVRDDCVTALQAQGYSWPQELNCSRFPEPNQVVCVQQSSDNELVPNHYLPDEIFNFNNCPPHTKLSGNKCVPLCHYNQQSQKKETDTFEIWVAVWSIICLIFTTFSLLTFLIQPKRFRWPARPILYLTSCGFITSTIYLIRWIEGPYTCTGESILEKPSESLSCVGISLILLFCDIAYTLWWCVFSFVWFLSAMKEWSTEAIEKISTRLHTSVWILSAGPMLYILISNNININHLSGFCEVKNVPLVMFQLVFLIIGSILAVLTSVALKNVRRTLVMAGRSPLKLERLLYRLLILSMGICMSHFLYLICQFYDSFSMTLVKLVLRKISIIFATLWVFSPKTFQVWSDVLCVPCKGRRKKHIVGGNMPSPAEKKSFFFIVFVNWFKTVDGLPKIEKSTAPLVPVTKV